jgi:hypothetical protein
MAPSADFLRAELARVFALMTKAREDGNIDLADLFAKHAAKLLMEVAEAEASERQQQPIAHQPPSPDQPVAQQQQQPQPDTDKPADTDEGKADK